MSSLKLIIGSKNSSSWSLRPWLLLKQVGVPFEEVVIPLRRPDSRERILAWSPSGKVPVLIVGEVKIWDSLAIAEFLAEHERGLWPEDARARAVARAISAEMHAGFQSLRTFLPMDFTARFGPPGKLLTSVQSDIRRVLEIWSECRGRFGQGGPFLFGRFSIADAMYAPVCSRFTTYAVPLDPTAQAYVEHMMSLPAMREWGEAARAEVENALTEPARGALLAEAAADRLPPTFAPAVLEAEPQSRAVEAPAWSRPAETAPAPQPRPIVTPPPEPAPTPVQMTAKAAAPAPPSAPAAIDEPRAPAPPEDSFAPASRPPVVPGQVLATLAEKAEEPRRAPRPVPSTIMIKPIGDGTRRRR